MNLLFGWCAGEQIGTSPSNRNHGNGQAGTKVYMMTGDNEKVAKVSVTSLVLMGILPEFFSIRNLRNGEFVAIDAHLLKRKIK